MQHFTEKYEASEKAVKLINYKNTTKKKYLSIFLYKLKFTKKDIYKKD